MLYTFAIGDIHGCLNQLNILRTEINKYRTDHNISDASSRFVFVGDYIDRGPDSCGVIETVMAMQKLGDVVALKGNHEEFMESDSSYYWVPNGGLETLKSYNPSGDAQDMPLFRKHKEWIKTLPYYFDDGLRFFVHAGVEPGDPLVPKPKSSTEAMAWIRDEFIYSHHEWPRLIVHGHTPTGLDIRDNRINLDSGCVFGRSLTCAVFTDEQVAPIKYLQVPGYIRGSF